VYNSTGMYNTDYQKRFSAEPQKFRKAICSIMHALHERTKVSPKAASIEIDQIKRRAFRLTGVDSKGI